jgi:hypothetical protein
VGSPQQARAGVLGEVGAGPPGLSLDCYPLLFPLDGFFLIFLPGLNYGGCFI